MTNTAIIEKDKFGGILFQIVKKMIRRVETGKSIVMRKGEKMKKGSCEKKSIEVE